VETIAANVADIAVAYKLIRADDDVVNAGAGYTGIERRKEIREDEHLSEVTYRINKKKGMARKREAALYKEPMNREGEAHPNALIGAKRGRGKDTMS
jgi:IS5 family transposase